MWLPIAHRELIVASRKPILAWARIVAPALGLLLVFLLVSPSEPPSRIGKTVFVSLSIVLFLYCTFAGLFFTAETITTERRDGTLPLLQVTGMRDLDLILGKLLGHSLPGIFGFIAATPLLALPLLLGGVTPFEIFRIAITLLATLLLSLSIAIHASSDTATSTAALKKSCSSIFVVLAIGIFGFAYFGLKNKMLDREAWAARVEQSGERALLVIMTIIVWALGLPSGSPAAMILEIFSGQSRLFGPLGFWVEILLLSFMIVQFLRSARPFSQADPAAIPAADISALRTQTPAPGRSLRRRHKHPLRARLDPPLAETMFLLGLGIIGAFLQFAAALPLHSSADPALALLNWFSFGVALVLYFILARRAAEFLVQSRRAGLLEVLLITPLTWRELLRFHQNAFLRLAWRPLAIFMAGEILGYLLALPFDRSASPFEYILLLIIVTALSYVTSLFATLWCGLHFALRARSATHAAIFTVLLVLVLPAAILFMIPFDLPNPVHSVFFPILLAGWLYVLVNSSLWIALRYRLNALGTRSPAEILNARLSRG